MLKEVAPDVEPEGAAGTVAENIFATGRIPQQEMIRAGFVRNLAFTVLVQFF